jgi:hypothetical protein
MTIPYIYVSVYIKSNQIIYVYPLFSSKLWGFDVTGANSLATVC